MVAAVMLVLNVLFWAVAEWPKHETDTYKKGFLYWGTKEEGFDGSNPKWVNRSILLGIIFFLISFTISLLEKEKTKWYIKNWINLLVNFVCVPLEIFSGAIIVLIFFSGLRFYFLPKISLLFIAFILFLATVDLRKQYTIK